MSGSNSSGGRREITLWAALFVGTNITVKAGYAGSMLLLATFLTPAEYANYGLLYALQGAATTLATIGLVEVTAGRLRDYSRDTRHRLFQEMSGLFLLTAALSCVLLSPLVWWFAGKGLGLAAVPAALLGIAAGLSVVQASFHRIDEQHAISLVSSAGVPLAAIAGVLVGLLLFGDLAGMFALGLLAAGGVIVGLAVTGHIFVGQLPTARAARVTGIELAPFLAIGIFGWASGYGMTLVLDWRFEPVDVASFTFIYTAASVGQVVASSMNMVWAPRYYHLFNNGEVHRAERQSSQFYAVMALALGLTGFAAAVALPWLTWFIGGNLAGYGRLRLEFILLLSAYVIATPFWHCQNLFFVTGRGRELMNNTLWSGALGFVTWIGCMFLLGPEGAYLGFFLQMAVRTVALWLHARRYGPVRPWWLAIWAAGALPFAALLVPAP
jgi:O-antigen/teichoic acid export membrane protein